MTVAHFTLELRAGHQGCHRIDDQDVDCSGADQRVRDLERLLSGIRLGNQQLVNVNPELSRIGRVEGVLRVDEGASAASALSLGNHMQSERSLTGAFRSVNLDNAAARQSADTERDIEAQRACGNHLGFCCGFARSEFHDRALAKGAFDLSERRVQSSLLVHRFLVQEAQCSLHYPSPLFHSRRGGATRGPKTMYTFCSIMQLASAPALQAYIPPYASTPRHNARRF